MKEDRLRLRPRLQRQRMKRQMRGIVGTTRVGALKVVRARQAAGMVVVLAMEDMVVAVVGDDRWHRKHPMWGSQQLQRDTRRVRPGRRLAGKR